MAGKTIGVAPLWGASVLETRYLLQEKYGLDVSPEAGVITFVEAPAESLPTLLSDGDVDAIIMLHLAAFRLLDDERFRVLSNVTLEMRELTDAPIVSSILITYPDVAEQKSASLAELNRMLTESLTYFRANQDNVIETVAVEQEIDQEFLHWWWERQDILFGDASTDAQGQLLDVWGAAKTIGDIDDVPDLASVLFGVEDEPPDEANSDRITVSLAVLDDPSRRAALYAIEQAIVTSDTVDIDLSYLPLSVMIEAAPSKQYDVIEATPLVVPVAAEELDFVVLSIGLQNLDGTLLFVRAT